MRQALTFKDSDYYFDVDSLKQFGLMDRLNYTYLCILLQRARFSVARQGQYLRAEYEPDFMVYLLKGCAVIKNEGIEKIIDENYKQPLFSENSQAKVIFTDESFIIRIERQLYDIFSKSSTLNSKMLY